MKAIPCGENEAQRKPFRYSKEGIFQSGSSPYKVNKIIDAEIGKCHKCGNKINMSYDCPYCGYVISI